MESKKISMFLVDSNDDVVIVPRDSCRKCFESKTGCKILKVYEISEDKTEEYMKNGLIRKIKPICECKA